MARPVLLSVLLVLMTAAVYWPVGGHQFTNYIDPDLVGANNLPWQGSGTDAVHWAFTTTDTGRWHPLTWLSHMLDSRLFGSAPSGHHLVNLLLHLANTVLLFLVLRRLTGAFWPSAFVAALFGVHPLNIETVAWVAARKHLLGMLFWLLTLWAYARYVQRPVVRRYLLVTACFLLGLLSHPLLLALPAILLLLDYWPLGRVAGLSTDPRTAPEWKSVSLGRLVAEKIPWLLLSLVVTIIALLAIRSQGLGEGNYSLGSRLAGALVSYATYVGKMILPDNLAAIYPHPGSFPGWQITGAVLLLVLVSLMVGLLCRNRPYLLTGWGWYVATLLPMAGLIQLGPHLQANRYAYVALIGLFIMLAWGVADLCASWAQRRLIVGLAGVLVLAGCVLTTSTQLRHWRNSVSLFEHTLAVTANNAVAHYCLGQALALQGHLDESADHYREALRIKPDYLQAMDSLALALTSQGDLEGATNLYGRALRLQPTDDLIHLKYGIVLADLGRPEAATAEFRESLKLAPDSHLAHAHLAMVLARQDRHEEALNHYLEALRISPDHPETLLSLAETYIALKQPDEAVQTLTHLARLQPDSSLVQAQLGLACRRQNKIAEAVQHFQEALRLQPENVEALNNLAWLRATHPNDLFRNGAEAVQLAQKACELTDRKQPVLLGTLAAAQAEAGQFQAAVATATQAEQLARALGLASLAETNKLLLQLYQEGKPYRAP